MFKRAVLKIGLRCLMTGGVATLAVAALWNARAATLEKNRREEKSGNKNLSATPNLFLATAEPARWFASLNSMTPITGLPEVPFGSSWLAVSEVPMADSPPTVNPNPVSRLDARRYFALGMIETGNNDREVGGAGEVSRYQIMPVVWKTYSPSRDYQNPDVSLSVARQHWTYLYDYFKAKAGREPTDFDMYVLWNTRYGYYSGKEFNPARLHPVIRDRAERFVNLVGRGE